MARIKKRWVIIGLLSLVGLRVVLAGWNGVRLWLAWRGVERIGFDPQSARTELASRLPSVTTTTEPPSADTTDTTTTTLATEIPPDAFDVYLAVGSDGSPRKDSVRADAILLFLLPGQGSDPMLVSIPRDLAVANPCTGSMAPINRTLAGCGDIASGPELLTIALEDFTGLRVTHFAIFGFEGFREVVDRLDGVRSAWRTPCGIGRAAGSSCSPAATGSMAPPP